MKYIVTALFVQTEQKAKLMANLMLAVQPNAEVSISGDVYDKNDVRSFFKPKTVQAERF